MKEAARELLLLRHGKAESGGSDLRRPLKDRGKRDAQRVGAWLQGSGLLPDTVLASPAERALVTAEKAYKAAGMGSEIIRVDQRIYAAELDDLLEVLRQCSPEAKRVLLVGHNPGLEELLQWLAKRPDALPHGGRLRPAALAQLRLECAWSEIDQGCGEVEEIVDPNSLPRKFPFPAPDGEELRDRPAYYYTQSSVVPWRVGEHGLEVLVISSSKRKHWVVPKGIKEPGLTPQASAANEALEEAGVEGVVGEEPIGRYTYPKWGAECTVEVYPMEVTRVLPESQWEERHRGREWVSVEEAARRLRQEALKPIVHGLPTRLATKAH